MPALRELQFAFSDALIHGVTPDALGQIKVRGLPGTARLGIYRNNVYITLTEALRGSFPVVERLVGADFFRHAAEHYVRAYPSLSGNLQDYGHRFPDFLKRFPATSRLVYLPDVARLEWYWQEVFHAQTDESEIDPRGLAEIPEDEHVRLGFVLNRAARLLHSPFPALRIWQANQDGADGEVDLAEGECQVLLLQRDYQVELHPLSAGEYWLLQALAQGETLGTAFEIAHRHEPKLELGTVLAKHLRFGTLARWQLIELPAPAVEFDDLTDDLVEMGHANVH